MLSDAIKLRLTERYAAPLPDFCKRRIVFWRDDDGDFADAVGELDLPGVTLVALTGRNNFAVKKLLAADDLTGNYLIYDPLSYGNPPADDWLLDIKLHSEEFRADLVSLQMEELNIEATPQMRKTVKLYAKFFENKERKARLRKIGRDYHAPAALHMDIMAVLCGLNGGIAEDVIIAVLSAGLDRESNAALDSIARFGSIDAFWQMVQRYTGYADAEGKPLSELANHILVTALSQTMNPSLLKGLERFISDSCKAYCYQMVREWRHDSGQGLVSSGKWEVGSGKREVGSGQKKDCSLTTNHYSLLDICRHVERELRLADRFGGIETDALLRSDTFPAIGESILKRYFAEIGENVIKAGPILKAVENRRTAAWYSLTANYCECLRCIAKMQEFYLAHIDGFHIVEPKGIWKLYVTDAYMMDSHYRHFHAAFGNTLAESNPLFDDALKRAADVVEGLYSQWYLKELTAAWTGAIAGDLRRLGYVSEIERQRDFYKSKILPIAGKGNRAFVIISDALRYEVAAELMERLNRNTKGEGAMETRQSIFPSVTAFGMAALLPGKEITVKENEKNLEVLVDGQGTMDFKSREAVLRAANPASAVCEYHELLKMKKQERRDLVAGQEVIYIYHNAIDSVGHKRQTENKTFATCETAIEEIAGIVRIVTNELSGTNILITADHGFLYTYSALPASEKASKKLMEGALHKAGRRYALTAPDAQSDYFLPVNLDGQIGGLAMLGYAPQETARIWQPWIGENYVHGGISLQEMVVPVIVYKGMRPDSKKYVEVKNPGLALVSVARKATNLMFSLDFLQQQPVGGKVQPCAYTLCFIDEAGAAVSDSQTLIANRTSANASERVFRARFALKPIAFDRNKIYRLRLSNDTDAPVEIEYHIDIAFADDFGFNP